MKRRVTDKESNKRQKKTRVVEKRGKEE